MVDLSSIRIASKLVWRNKRRFFIILGGTIFALTVMSSMFLVSNYQGHIMGISMVEDFQPPIYISERSNINQFGFNVSEYKDLDDIVYEADALHGNLVEKTVRYCNILAVQHLENFTVEIIFPTTDGSISDWDSLDLNQTRLLDYSYYASDTPASAYSHLSYLMGRAPENPMEISVSESLANDLNISINDTMYFASNLTRHVSSAFTVVGIVDDIQIYYSNVRPSQDYSYAPRNVYMFFEECCEMIENVSSSEVVSVYATGTVYVKLEDVSIYNIRDFIQKIDNLANVINQVLINRGYNLEARNIMHDLAQYYMLIVFVWLGIYLLMLLGLLAPVISLSNYLSKVISIEFFEKRTVEFAQFRSRGFTKNQMRKVIAAEIFISSLICATISGIFGVLLSYYLQPYAVPPESLVFVTSEEFAYNPFPNDYLTYFYVGFIFLVSWIMVWLVYKKPLRLAFQKEMMDSIKAQRKQKRRRAMHLFSILLMYLIGGIPLGIYLGLIFYPGSTQSWFYQWLSIFAGTVVSFLSILSPFLLAIASIKLVAELSPRSFAKFCTIFLRKKTMLQHVVVRNIASKSKSVSKIMLIVSFTIAFSLMISISDRSLSYYNIEKSQLALGSDIKVKFSMDRDMINSTMNTLLKNATFETNTTAQRGENITAMAFKISKNGQIQGQSNNQFQYNSFMFHCMNMTDYLKVTRAIQKDKFLSGVTWAELRNTLESNSSDNIALLPVEFQDAVEETTFTLVFTFWDENWTESIEYTKEFRIAGFFKAFPGIQEYEDWIIRPMQFFPMGYPVIVNLDFTKVFSQVENIYESFDFQVSIDTILNKQEDIDNFARLLNFTGHPACTGYETMSNMTEQSGFTGFNPINSPAF
ncbi:MAG: FtsX-like permease family protein, partial [Promethearchaeota archaeon]